MDGGVASSSTDDPRLTGAMPPTHRRRMLSSFRFSCLSFRNSIPEVLWGNDRAEMAATPISRSPISATHAAV
jgi:hypothetical protein